MSEYIFCEVHYGYMDGTALGRRLEKQEQIVRCKDCKFCEQQKVRYAPNPIYVCLADWCMGSEGDNPLVEPDGFCAWGERRNDA